MRFMSGGRCLVAAIIVTAGGTAQPADASLSLAAVNYGRTMTRPRRSRATIVPAMKTECNWVASDAVCCVSRNRFGVGTCCCVGGVACSCGYRSKFDGTLDP